MEEETLILGILGILGIILLFLITQRWFWLLVLGLCGLASLFSMIASINPNTVR